MREIKFRVWTGMDMEYNVVAGKFGKFFVNPGEKKDGLDPKDSASLTPFNTKYSDDAPLMQFTGLKDSKGKEVFEGDIMEFDKDEWGGEGNIHVVSWDTENAEWSWGGGTTGDMHFRTVIGNIYENPNLLN